MTKDDIIKVLKETAKYTKLKYDSMIAIAISSHRCEEGLLGIQMEEILEQENDPNHKNMDDCIPPTQILEIFNGENCTSLVGKPKLFLLNGCRGKGIEKIVQMERDVEHFSADGPAQSTCSRHCSTECLATTWSDFFVIHSCVPGKISLRSSKVGSLFLIEFSERLNSATLSTCQ